MIITGPRDRARVLGSHPGTERPQR